jgi:hypothetical protein
MLGRMSRTLLIILATLALLTAGGCGGDDAPNSPRAAAEAFVEALREREWESACDLWFPEGGARCIELAERAFTSDDRIPTVEEAEKVVEKVDGRYIVHFEVAAID